MAAVSKTNKNIPDDMLLGNLLFMSVTDVEMSSNDLEKIFDDNGLNKSYIRPIFPSDAFRRATSSFKNMPCGIKDTKTQDLINASIVIDETNNTDEKIVRVASLKLVDRADEMSNYIPFMRIVFDKTTEQVMVSHIASAVYNVGTDTYTKDSRYVISQPVQKIENSVGNLYQHLRTTHNKDTIRNIIKRIVDSMQPVTLMQSGICKFVPIKHKDTLYGLKGALMDMNNFALNSENAVEIIPLIDTDEQRDNIMLNMERETKEQLLKLTTDLQALLSKKSKLTTRSANAYIQRFKELRQKSEDYQTLMNSYNSVILQQIDNMLVLVDNSIDKDGA